jgi:hypothetical protein
MKLLGKKSNCTTSDIDRHEEMRNSHPLETCAAFASYFDKANLCDQVRMNEESGSPTQPVISPQARSSEIRKNKLFGTG